MRSLQDRKSLRGSGMKGSITHRKCSRATLSNKHKQKPSVSITWAHFKCLVAQVAHVVAAMLHSADLEHSIITSSVDWLVLL